MEMTKYIDFEVLKNSASKSEREVDIELEIDGFPECGVEIRTF